MLRVSEQTYTTPFGQTVIFRQTGTTTGTSALGSGTVLGLTPTGNLWGQLSRTHNVFFEYIVEP